MEKKSLESLEKKGDDKKEKDPKLQKRGKLSRQRGQLFEVKVREDLEEKGWIVTRWMNTVDFERDCVTPARRKYNPFIKALSIGNGFPDFLCFKKNGDLFEVLGVEVKMNGMLDKFEKGQAVWYLQKRIIPRILVAKKTKVKNRVVIEYEDFSEVYPDGFKKVRKKKEGLLDNSWR